MQWRWSEAAACALKVRMAATVQQTLAETYQQQGARIRAVLIRATRDFTLAEDALSAAAAQALESWPQAGIPQRPGAWLQEVARRRAVDVIRKAQRFRNRVEALAELEQMARAQTPADDVADRPTLERGPHAVDDRLRLVFTCCHPALAEDVRVVLTLQVVAGLTAQEIARAFLTQPAAMEKRLARAKQKIRDAGIPYEVPSEDALPQRLSSVLHVVYLIFNEGYLASRGDDVVRLGLCQQALRIARLLDALLPDQAEVGGLLALLLLTAARADARVDANGDLVLLEDQDRSRWDAGMVTAGLARVESALRMGSPGPFQVQAAIAAVHAEATDATRTDWKQIAALYTALVGMNPTPVVRLNHAVAVALGHSIQAGLSLIGVLDREGALKDYHLLHAARADLLRRLGQHAQALKSYRRALQCTVHSAERRFLEKRMAQVKALMAAARQGTA